MGRSFKLNYKSQVKPVKQVKEPKIIYNHIYKVKSNPLIIKEFKKNMDKPSKLWGENVDIIYKYNQDIFKDKGLYEAAKC